MAAKPQTLQPSTSANEEQPDNGYKKLLPLLNRALAKAPHLQPVWQRLDWKLVFYLTHTVAKKNAAWLNHLTLAGCARSEAGSTAPLANVGLVGRFLDWTIPALYPNLAALEPEKALMAYFGDPPLPRGEQAMHAYHSLQVHVQHYLSSLPASERVRLERFVLPILHITPKISKLAERVQMVREIKRKEQAHAVVRDLVALIAMGRRRYKWLADLDAQVQHVTELVKNGQLTLPAVITCRDLDDCQDLTFRLWDPKSWIKAHESSYGMTSIHYRRTTFEGTFLQLVGALPATTWFLRAVEIEAIGRQPSPVARQYLAACGMRTMTGQDGILAATSPLARTLFHARCRAAGTPDDSRVLFWVEPLLAAAALGLFALVCFTQTAMRMGELQQVSFDDACLKFEPAFPQFNGRADEVCQEERLFWMLYPKGQGDKREPYVVTAFMKEALVIWMQTHERFCGSWKAVPAENRMFSHTRQYPGKHKFALQWKGKHLGIDTIETCLDFLMLEHECLDSNGRTIRITAHVWRHGVATYLLNRGIPLEAIAELLHQVDLGVTAYYCKQSPEDLYQIVGPALTQLAALAEVDPRSIRTPGDLDPLIQSALKRFGVLCHIPGGSCCSLQSCEVQFKCAACAHYVPDPARRQEVENQMAVCQKAIQFFENEGDHLQARNYQARLHNWERVMKEIDALATVQLATRPLSEMLEDLGVKKTSEQRLSLCAPHSDWPQEG